MWSVWRQRNVWNFEDCEKTIMELKLLPLKALYMIGWLQMDFFFLNLVRLSFDLFTFT